MYKKLILSCMAVAAFAAFVLPATASAATATDAKGDVAVGASITGKNVGETFFMRTDGTTPEVTCTNADAVGTVTKNSGGVFAGSITSFKFSGTGAVAAHNGLNECTAAIGNAWITVLNLPLTIEALAGTDNVTVTGKEGKKVKFIIGSTVAGECEYETTNASVTGTFTTGPTAVVSTNNTQAGSGSKLIRGGFFCPTSGQLKMSFFLATTNGEEIFIS
jgi:hypothetical protein